VIRAASQETPDEKAEVECALTVAALEVPGRIGILLAATEFSVIPGSSTTIPLVLLNQGLDHDSFQLSVDGIPTAWVSTPSAVTPLAPGQQKEVSLTIQPPRSMQSSAGRNPFKIQVVSQATPYQVAEAECTLSIATFTQFTSELRPQRVEAGEPARITVENQGNVQQNLTLTWQSPNDELAFEPGAVQQVQVPAGQAAMVEFQASPRKRPFLGGEFTLPFTTRIESTDREAQHLRGEVVSRALLPSWVVPLVLGLIMLTACIVVFSTLLSGIDREARPTEPPPPEATVAPTDVPPEPAPTEVPPTEVPPEPPTEEPPPQPTEEPPVEPTQEPPVEPTDDPGSGTGPELPCAPAAAPLIIVPLLVQHRKRQKRDKGGIG
jgi:hypothetical protein